MLDESHTSGKKKKKKARALTPWDDKLMHEERFWKDRSEGPGELWGHALQDLHSALPMPEKPGLPQTSETQQTHEKATQGSP